MARSHRAQHRLARASGAMDFKAHVHQAFYHLLNLFFRGLFLHGYNHFFWSLRSKPLETSVCAIISLLPSHAARRASSGSLLTRKRVSLRSKPLETSVPAIISLLLQPRSSPRKPGSL